MRPAAKEPLRARGVKGEVGTTLFSPERLARLLYPSTLTFLIVSAVVLIALAILVRVPATYRLDLIVTRELQETTHPALDAVARWMTFMGNSATLALLAAGVLGIALYAGVATAGIFALLSLLSLPINVVVKNMVDRRRPEPEEVRVLPGPRWGFSFPSGHSMGSASFYGFLAVLVWLHVAPLGPRIALLIPFLALPPLIGWSRIWLGAHWLSDVVGGIAGGMTIVVLLAALYPVY